MILDAIYTQNDILETAMQAAIIRNDVITNNIANVDTPGYKAKTVSFEKALQSALERAKLTGKLDLSGVRASVNVSYPGYHYRLDENNVDIEAEMVALYQNSVKYDALTSAVISNNKRINLVLTGR